MQSPARPAPSAALRGRGALRLVVLWTLLMALLGWWLTTLSLGSYREQSLSAAQARLQAARDTLSVGLGQLSALPAWLTRRSSVRELLAVAPADIDPALQQRVNEELQALIRDFNLPYVAVIDASGSVRASASPTLPPPGAPPLNLSSRSYFADAMRVGTGVQFLLGRISRAPGLYVARRVDGDGGTLGVVVVKQDADTLNRLLGDAAGNIVLLSDANGVVVLGNRRDQLLHRLDGPPPGDIDWIDIYQQVPPPLGWTLQPADIGAQGVKLTNIDGLQHLVQSTMLPGTPLKAWVLAPLEDEPALRTAMLGGFFALWLFGSLLIWLGWRRLHFAEAALNARRDADEFDRARRDTEARFAAVFEHAAAAYLFFTPRGITHCNPATLRLFDVDSTQELIGRIPWFPPLSPERQPDGLPSRERAFALMKRHTETRERVQTCEWRFQRHDGSKVDTDAAVIALDWGEPPQFCAVIQDVTARKQAEAAMRDARAAAEAASQTKSSFLANMSHELRTPMNAIIGMTHLALADGLPPRQRDYVEKAHGAARNLLQILNDILDVSKIESGRLELEQIDFDVEAVLRDTADLLGLKADEKGLELLVDLGPGLPGRLRGDPTRLRQVFVNLGGNAIKFTEHGEVTLGIALQSRDAQGVELHGWVRDSGVGLSEEQLAQLFQPFVQADSSTTRRYGGTGLGLVISRQLVERMGGRLWVDSRPGAGSTFHFVARFAPGTPQPEAQARKGLAGRRALLVDDNGAALQVLSDMLTHWQIEVDRASGGGEALARAAQAGVSHYDWILLDWKMPDIDGLECARRLIAQHAPQAPAPTILMVTAFGREALLREAEGLPLAGVLQKPVTPSSLHDALLAAQPGLHPPVPAPPFTPMHPGDRPETLAGARILLVEDHPLNQELACELLRRAGMQVVVAGNGADALARLADAGPFDGVLMDCQMPVMDGYTATRRLRAEPRWRELPVIAMTASALAEDRERSQASGMNAHITKPLDVGLMLRTMAQWIRPQRGAAPTAAPPTLPGALDEPWPPACEAIDTAAGLGYSMGKAAIYRRVLDGFREAQEGFADLARNTPPAERATVLRRRVHDLKGLAGTIGARRLHAAFAALEQGLRHGDGDPASALAELERVLHDIEQLLEP